MSKQKGFTLVELMIVIVMIGIFGTIILNAVGAVGTNNSTISYGINGMTEIRCIDGYKFVISQHGGTRQVLDEFGKGAKCQ